MKITFPHMGNSHIAIKALLTGLKLEVILPPPITKRTLELGVKYSPEFACLPLKINVGNFIEALEQGADTVLMAGGWGPCRFGYYAQVERDILQDLGYSFRMVVLEAPDFKLSELLNQIKDLAGNVTTLEALRAARFAWYKLNAVDRLESCLERVLPRAVDKDKVMNLYHLALREIDGADSREQVKRVLNNRIIEMEKMEQHREPVLRIGLVGEIYTILEPSCNYHIIEQLGRMNVEVKRSVYTSNWVNDHLLGGLAKGTNRRQILASARPYLNYFVGGHGRETVGYTVEFARQSFDGIIQIGPLTCMPEIVAQSVLGQVGEQEGIPVMTMYFDEHSAAAGIQTRLEAFVDMLQRRKRLGQLPIQEEDIHAHVPGC
ncbi:MAG TPA: CoA protein activase [Syntrophomonadaceae bacterium]|nr:CoA protein activase [Syntrophomonadaceae bacterium]HOQ09124.1 CoA protein activase [Syntrophomonadaceae bacterium]HPU48922.1 CoA protein activase [Syntrophomonadaceae bacterium]